MKEKNVLSIILIVAFFSSMFMLCLFGPKADYSESERRVLAAFPKLNMETVMSGDFAKKFEEYATDRFPGRDIWRSVKAYTEMYLFGKKDNNDIFLTEGHICKLEYPMNEKMADHAIELFKKINEKYLTDNKAYLVVIPDKNRYLAKSGGYLAIDYEKLSSYVEEGVDFAEYIEISDLLSAEDYYFTDTHWRQDKIADVAERIADKMGVDVTDSYTKHTLDIPFNGVYVGQSALKVKPDTITYLTSDGMEAAVTEGAKAVYDMEKAKSKDPYEMFLSGNQPVVTVKNPNNTTGKRLVMFRDSFGSSLAPLFIKGYSEIVLVDLRYIASDFVGQFVDFKNADVLFVYSTLLLNNSMSMK